MKLETERLILVPLSLENFKLYLENRKELEESLGVVVTGENTSPEKKQIFQEPYEKARKDKANHLWYTNWQIILKEENRIVGGITFKGIPNDAGEVEIGYGTRDGYKNKGYMTEAVNRLVKWAFEQKEVNTISAETKKDNKASQKVLKKSGFKKISTNEKYCYRMEKDTSEYQKKKMKNKKTIDTIIFDAGGILFYINEFRNQIIKRVLSSIGYNKKIIEKALLAAENFDSNYFDGHRDISSWQDEKRWLEAKYSFIADVVDNGNTELADKLMILAFDTFQYKLFEDTVSTLENLKSKYKLSVLSNATATLDWAFDFLDVRKYFDKVIISSYEKCNKPNKDLYIIALNKLSKSPEQCIFIDDRIENVAAARNLGIKSFHLVRNNGRTLKDFENYLENIN